MCVYCRAASTVLDALWGDQEFRSFFYNRSYDLSGLGPLTHDVFVPAYLSVKQSLQGGELEMLEAQVTQDVLSPLYRRARFREIWEQWDQATRDAFLREQSEMQLAELLVMVYDARLSDAYRQGFMDYVR
jgi:hypothetical protein